MAVRPNSGVASPRTIEATAIELAGFTTGYRVYWYGTWAGGPAGPGRSVTRPRSSP